MDVLPGDGGGKRMCLSVCRQVNESEDEICSQIREPDESLITTKEQDCLMHVADSSSC